MCDTRNARPILQGLEPACRGEASAKTGARRRSASSRSYILCGSGHFFCSVFNGLNNLLNRIHLCFIKIHFTALLTHPGRYGLQRQMIAFTVNVKGCRKVQNLYNSSMRKLKNSKALSLTLTWKNINSMDIILENSSGILYFVAR